mmetsp:Transcript_28713/g.46594  ORF Transcript_28713/g.46594 Transcript_28713/m.46594 type:complete len:145 (-) Transcript_28713:1089-1523(-)
MLQICYSLRMLYEKSRSGKSLGATKVQIYNNNAIHWDTINIHIDTSPASGLDISPLLSIDPHPVSVIAYQQQTRAIATFNFHELLNDVGDVISDDSVSSFSFVSAPSLFTTTPPTGLPSSASSTDTSGAGAAVVDPPPSRLSFV